MSTHTSTPTFAVVGHPNKGKSSIVATLSENQSIDISPVPGTTHLSDQYTLTVDGEPLYTLVDTPGFQRAGAVLRWLKSHEGDASTRYKTVERFVAHHQLQDSSDFHDECQLLAPILAGAGIIYVVDGAKPYGAEYEVEMQILQWTGQPRMALINQIGPGDYIDQWEQALGQYFSIVRTFNAMHADFDKRLGLLEGFGELAEGWKQPLRQAIQALTDERTRQRTKSSEETVHLIFECMTMQLEKALENPEPSEDLKDKTKQRLTEQLTKRLKRREQRTRDLVQAIYRHSKTDRTEDDLRILDKELFAEETWQLFGLSRQQLITTGSISGAVAGGGLDLLVGGLSFFTGTIGGAIVGGLSAWLGGDELAKVEVLGTPLGGEVVRVGPIGSHNFPWVLLGRAWVHHQLVSERNHAARSTIALELNDDLDLFEELDSSLRKSLDQSFARIRAGDHSERVRALLNTQVIELFAQPRRKI